MSNDGWSYNKTYWKWARRYSVGVIVGLILGVILGQVVINVTTARGWPVYGTELAMIIALLSPVFVFGFGWIFYVDRKVK